MRAREKFARPCPLSLATPTRSKSKCVPVSTRLLGSSLFAALLGPSSLLIGLRYFMRLGDPALLLAYWLYSVILY